MILNLNGERFILTRDNRRGSRRGWHIVKLISKLKRTIGLSREWIHDWIVWRLDSYTNRCHIFKHFQESDTGRNHSLDRLCTIEIQCKHCSSSSASMRKTSWLVYGSSAVWLFYMGIRPDLLLLMFASVDV